MKTKQVSTEKFEEIPEIRLPSIGLGTMRTSGTYIALLLQLENKGRRVEIMVNAAKKLGISLEEITDTYLGCPKCGMSMKPHKARGGHCF